MSSSSLLGISVLQLSASLELVHHVNSPSVRLTHTLGQDITSPLLCRVPTSGLTTSENQDKSVGDEVMRKKRPGEVINNYMEHIYHSDLRPPIAQYSLAQSFMF